MAEAISEKTTGLSFAEQQMLRHGWQPGKGLGRQENGMSEPIKVKVKSGKGGVGHKLGDQFTFNWWDHVFNKASSNLSVESGQDGVTMKKVNDEEEEGMISNKRPLAAKLAKNMQYGCFVKSATLLSGEEQPEQRASGSDDSSDSDDDDQKLDLSSATSLSDAALLKICGGRTAHKGARHGLTMSAKLARLEQQELEFMAKYGKKATPASSAAPSPDPSPTPVSAPLSPSRADDDGGGGGGDKDVPIKTKRKKEKKRRTEEAEAELPDAVTNGDIKETADIPDGGKKEKKKKKKKKSSKEEVDAVADNSPPVEASLEDQEMDDAQSKKKKKKKKRHQEVQENGREEDATTASTEEPVAVDDHSPSLNGDCEKQSKKKRSKKRIANGVDSVVNGQHDADGAKECDRDSEVTGAGTEDCALNQETSIDADSKTKKKKKKKSSKSKDIVTLCQEGETQSEDLQEIRSDVVMDGEEESTDVKSKSKKRKATGLNNTECNDDGDTIVKKKSKAERLKKL